jgi:hypothetical protein
METKLNIDLNKIKQKVRKLIAMADHQNSNTNEADTAARLAKQLLEQYNLELDENSPDKVVSYILHYKGKTASFSEFIVSTLLAKFAGVEVLQSSSGFFIVGTETGISFFITSFNSTLTYLETGWQRFLSTLPSHFSRAMKLSHRRSYEEGFHDGVKEILDKECISLQLYKPETEINNFLSTYRIKAVFSQSTSAGTSFTSYYQGVRDGRSSRNSNIKSLQSA